MTVIIDRPLVAVPLPQLLDSGHHGSLLIPFD